MLKFFVFVFDFFKEWKRRIGLLGLIVIGSVVVRGMEHSYSQPSFWVDTAKSSHSIGYTPTGLACVIDEQPCYLTTQHAERCLWDWDWKILGFRWAERQWRRPTDTGIVDTHTTFFKIPYWFIVV